MWGVFTIGIGLKSASVQGYGLMAIACPYLETLDEHYEQLEAAADGPPLTPDEIASTVL